MQDVQGTLKTLQKENWSEWNHRPNTGWKELIHGHELLTANLYWNY